MYSPVVVFVYNRPLHTAQMLNSLANCTHASQTTVFVYADAANKPQDLQLVTQVHSVVNKFAARFANLHLIVRPTNMGLAVNIIDGVSTIIAKYGTVIVMEDDLQVSPNFLHYMNTCLNTYVKRNDIFAISGYCAPIKIPHNYTESVFLFQRINSWGWATWTNRWQKVDWKVADFKIFIRDKKQRTKFNAGGEDCSVMLLDQMRGRINSWAIRFNYAAYKAEAYTIYPTISKVKNLGADGSGSHIKRTTKYDTSIDTNMYSPNCPLNISPNTIIMENYRRFFDKTIQRKIINFLKIWTLR